MAPGTEHRVGGRYELTRRIGRGGGGTVWAGYDHLLDREVAVKHVVIPDELPAGERDKVRARVRSEARAAARLLHPSAVAIFDVVPEDGDVYLVLELVDDPTLAERVAEDGPLDEVDAARVGLGLLDVLVAAHARGIVHRDVKPSNIFVSSDAKVKLSDFGIASVEGEMRLTRTGATMGSPQYIAPEQAIGHDAAPAADLWGLGVSLYLAIEGVPPFERSNAVATVHAVVHDDPRPFERADALTSIVRGLLAKEPADRAGVDEVRPALARVAGVDAEPVAAAAPPVVPVRSSTDAPPAASPPPPESSPPVPDDTAVLSEADATVPTDTTGAQPARTEAPTAGTTDGGPPRRLRWLLIVAALVALAVIGIAVLTNGDPATDDTGTPTPAEDTDGAPAEEEPTDDAGEDAPPPEEAPDEDEATGEEGPDEAPGDVPDEEPSDAPAEDEGPAEGDVPEAAVPDDRRVVDGPASEVPVPSAGSGRRSGVPSSV